MHGQEGAGLQNQVLVLTNRIAELTTVNDSLKAQVTSLSQSGADTQRNTSEYLKEMQQAHVAEVDGI